MNILDSLKNRQRFSENEQAIATYVIEHPEQAAKLSSRELARRTFTSPTAVLRFCKKLGFENYNDFKVNIVSELKSVNLATTLISEHEPAVNTLNKLATLEAQVIEETKRKASPETLDAIANAIVSNPYIDIFARDCNAQVARYAAHNFTMAGRITTVLENMDKMIYSTWELPRDHTVFLISKSGEDHVIVAAAEQMRMRKIPLIAITADTSSRLANISDYTLEGFYYPQFEKFGDIVFSSAAKYLLDVLFVMAFSKDVEHVRKLNAAYDALYYSRLNRARD